MREGYKQQELGISHPVAFSVKVSVTAAGMTRGPELFVS